MLSKSPGASKILDHGHQRRLHNQYLSSTSFFDKRVKHSLHRQLPTQALDFVECFLRHVQVYLGVTIEQWVQQGLLAHLVGGGVGDLDPGEALVCARYQTLAHAHVGVEEGLGVHADRLLHGLRQQEGQEHPVVLHPDAKMVPVDSRLKLEAGVEGVAVVTERESELILENLCQLRILLSPIFWSIQCALDISSDIEFFQDDLPGIDTDP